MQLRLPNFNKARILVVGDVMLDRYWSGTTSRISPEAPVPVVHVQDVKECPGGAGNVALNIAALGSNTQLLSVCGADAAADSLESKLTAANVRCYLQRISHVPTITKLRILSLHQQLLRLDFEEPLHDYSLSIMPQKFAELMPHVDVVVLSDYAKGSLHNVQELIRLARKANIPVFVDPKGQDFSIYQGATLLTPNRKEFEAVVGVCKTEAELISKARRLMETLQISALLVTRGEQGMTLLRPDVPELHLPAQAREVYDVTGAGDTVIGVMAATYAASGDLAQAAEIANIAAGIVVGKLGAATVSVPELQGVIQQEQVAARGVMTEEQLAIAMELAHKQGERIVMTGGCFDILHAGHIAYLTEAKRLGDRLIIAVNDDASVARLKGADRPINTLSRRMAVLVGLHAVDWVVSFSEDTPQRIIQHLKPDVWVKGGDYRVEDLPESQSIQAYGGQVKILSFIPDHSTTDIVNKIKTGEKS